MPQLTVGALDTRILSRVDNNSLLFTQPERYAALTESSRVLNCLTSWSITSVNLSQPTQPCRVWYDVPYGLIIPTRVQIDGRFLKKTTLNQLARSRPNWVTETTSSQEQPVTHWLPIGLRKFGIWPADACGGQQIIVSGPTDIQPYTDPNQTVSLSNDLLSSFDTLAILTLMLKESSKTFGQASVEYQSFLRTMKKMTVIRDFRAPSYYVAELQQPQNKG